MTGYSETAIADSLNVDHSYVANGMKFFYGEQHGANSASALGVYNAFNHRGGARCLAVRPFGPMRRVVFMLDGQGHVSVLYQPTGEGIPVLLGSGKEPRDFTFLNELNHEDYLDSHSEHLIRRALGVSEQPSPHADAVKTIER